VADASDLLFDLPADLFVDLLLVADLLEVLRLALFVAEFLRVFDVLISLVSSGYLYERLFRFALKLFVEDVFLLDEQFEDFF